LSAGSSTWVTVWSYTARGGFHTRTSATLWSWSTRGRSPLGSWKCLGAVPGAIAQAPHRHPGVDERPHGGLRIGLGGQRGDTVEGVLDLIVAEAPTAEHAQRGCSDGRKRLVVADQGCGL